MSFKECKLWMRDVLGAMNLFCQILLMPANGTLVVLGFGLLGSPEMKRIV